MKLYFSIHSREESKQTNMVVYSVTGAMSRDPEKDFVGPITLSVLTKQEFDGMAPGTMVEFVSYDSYDPAVHKMSPGEWAALDRGTR